ncbi:MAG: UDP-N-acetylmuramoyl-L-alanyl-D-glutamate--2,6-diaminopimelate ligase [Candidatus Delongbacteria bacterium]|nr:UDP-N-acetylmuramoyl-L-alanyl-D-glutamate--2,6-diaminopimelate ligase [Candidatus Delongbacteria bacterium]
MKLNDILENIDAIQVDNFSNIEIKQVVSDSRENFKDSIFIAVKGLQSDGTSFVKTAIENGSVAVVYETEIKEKVENVVYIKVKDSRAIQSKIASIVYGHPAEKLKLIGVTGTNGKTSFAYIFRHIINYSEIKCCMLGTTEYDLGKRKYVPLRTTPDAVFLQRYLKEMVSSGCSMAVLEVSSHALALKRVEEVEFDISVYTNLSQDHLDFHENMEDYAEAKSLLFSDHTKKGGSIVLNRDDDHFSLMRSKAGAKVITYSMIRDDADLFIRNHEYVKKGMKICFKFNDQEYEITTNLTGDYQAYNIAAAILAAEKVGIKIEDIITSFRDEINIPGRMELIRDEEFKVYIDYAHTPDALERSLKSIENFAAKRIITVFGCGGNRDKDKRSIMGKVATELSDYVYITSDNPRYEDQNEIITAILEGISSVNYEVIPDRKLAIKTAIENAREGDIILIAGKGHETYQEINGVNYPFSDKKIAQEHKRK